MDGALDTAVALARAAVFIFALQAAGAVLFLAGLRGDRSLIDSVRRIAAWSVGFALIGIVLRSVLEPIRMAGSVSGATDLGLVAFFWQSNVGFAQIARVVGLALCAALCAVRAKPSMLAAWIVAGLIAVSFALMGHTRSHAPMLGVLLVAHLLGAAYWFGALLPLHVALRRASGPPLVTIVQDFSRRAVWLMPVMFVAGVTIAWQLLGSLAGFATPYGSLLLVKIGGFLGLAALGAVNRFRLTPALEREPERAARAFRRVVRIEIAIMLVVLVATATMTTLYSPEPGSA